MPYINYPSADDISAYIFPMKTLANIYNDPSFYYSYIPEIHNLKIKIKPKYEIAAQTYYRNNIDFKPRIILNPGFYMPEQAPTSLDISSQISDTGRPFYCSAKAITLEDFIVKKNDIADIQLDLKGNVEMMFYAIHLDYEKTPGTSHLDNSTYMQLCFESVSNCDEYYVTGDNPIIRLTGPQFSSSDSIPKNYSRSNGAGGCSEKPIIFMFSVLTLTILEEIMMEQDYEDVYPEYKSNYPIQRLTVSRSGAGAGSLAHFRGDVEGLQESAYGKMDISTFDEIIGDTPVLTYKGKYGTTYKTWLKIDNNLSNYHNGIFFEQYKGTTLPSYKYGDIAYRDRFASPKWFYENVFIDINPEIFYLRVTDFYNNQRIIKMVPIEYMSINEYHRQLKEHGYCWS